MHRFLRLIRGGHRVLLNCRFLWAVVVGGVALVFEAVPSAAPSLGVSPAWAQAAPVELTETDITKLKTLDASQWAVLSVRLGESKEAALKSLQQTSNIKVQDDPAAGRIYGVAGGGRDDGHVRM